MLLFLITSDFSQRRQPSYRGLGQTWAGQEGWGDRLLVAGARRPPHRRCRPRCRPQPPSSPSAIARLRIWSGPALVVLTTTRGPQSKVWSTVFESSPRLQTYTTGVHHGLWIMGAVWLRVLDVESLKPPPPEAFGSREECECSGTRSLRITASSLLPNERGFASRRVG